MNSQIWLVSVVLLFGLDSALGDEQPVSLFENVPADWRIEIISFPLEFAPDIELTGVEELQFAPGMMKAGTEDFFSYAFVWWVDGDELLSTERLRADLQLYYDGLYAAVAQAESPGFTLQLDEADVPRLSWGMARQYRGTIDWIEPFQTKQPQLLNLVAGQWVCPQEGKIALHVLVSPQPETHAVWDSLYQLRSGRCQSGD